MKNGDDNNKKSGPAGALKYFALGSTIAFQFAVSILLGLWGGRYLDQKFDTEPYLMLAGLLLGIAAGTLGIYRTISRIF